MFQYAVGKSIANQTDSVLKFDITSLEKNQMPYHTLTKNEKISYLKESILGFDLDFTIATNKEIRNIRSIFDERKIRYQPIIKLVSKISPKKKSYYKEKIIHTYDPEIFEKGEHIYLDGTFINPNYFKQIKIELISDFKLKDYFSFSTNKLYNKIINTESVSIHIRRGDYINQSETKSIYPLHGMDYVKDAIKLIESKINNLTYFIFSDDIDWCKKNINMNKSIYFVSDQRILEDFWLMKSCKHNIISNSTFSWWAAWLNDNTSKIVICPKKWRNDHLNPTDLIIRTWIAI